jgi:hypothetical protein
MWRQRCQGYDQQQGALSAMQNLVREDSSVYAMVGPFRATCEDRRNREGVVSLHDHGSVWQLRTFFQDDQVRHHADIMALQHVPLRSTLVHFRPAIIHWQECLRVCSSYVDAVAVAIGTPLLTQWRQPLSFLVAVPSAIIDRVSQPAIFFVCRTRAENFKADQNSNTTEAERHASKGNDH